MTLKFTVEIVINPEGVGLPNKQDIVREWLVEKLEEKLDYVESIKIIKVEENLQCTCGSGGHPRKCGAHPEAYQKHINELEYYSHLDGHEFHEDECQWCQITNKCPDCKRNYLPGNDVVRICKVCDKDN